MTRALRLLFLAAGVVLLGWLLSRVDVAAFHASLRDADALGLAAAGAFLGANVTLKALRWQWMVRRLTGRRLELPSAAGAILAGVAAASFSPARTVDLAKPLLLRQRFDAPLAPSTAAVLVERFLDGAALVALFVLSLPLLQVARGAPFHPVLVASGILLVAGVAAFASPDRLRRAATRLIRTLPLSDDRRDGSSRAAAAFTDSLLLWRSRANLWPLVGWSVGAALCDAARLAAVFAALGLPLGFPGAMLCFSAASLVAVLALVPGGIGVTELSMAAVAGLVLGMPAGSSALAGAVLLDRMLSYYLVAGAGALVLVSAGRAGPRGVRAT